MKTIGITLMAAIVAVQLLLFGLLALCCNNAVMGFMLGVALPEAIRLLPKMTEDRE